MLDDIDHVMNVYIRMLRFYIHYFSKTKSQCCSLNISIFAFEFFRVLHPVRYKPTQH